MKMTAWLLALLLAAAWEPGVMMAQSEAGPGDDMGIEMEMDGPGGEEAWGPGGEGGAGPRDVGRRRGMRGGEGFGPEGGDGFGPRGRGRGTAGRRGEGFGPRGGMGPDGGKRARARRMMKQMKNDPEVREMMKRKMGAQRKLKKLVAAYRQEKDKKAKAKLEPEIKNALEENFEADLAGHEMKLKKMEAQLEKLQGRIKKRRQLKDKIVEKKFGELTGDDEGWEW